MQEKIQRILDQGVNAIFTTKGIDDFAMKYLVEALDEGNNWRVTIETPKESYGFEVQESIYEFEGEL